VSSTFADADAGIRAAIAAYAHAVDDGRPDDVVATFCPDGRVHLPGVGRLVGHEAIHAAFAAMKTRSLRHVMVNTHVTEWDALWAKAVSDLIVLRRNASGWAVHLVGRYDDVFHFDAGRWRFHSRKLEFTEPDNV
jgi:hypothetical protein